MASVKSKHTKPETTVRKLAHRLGYRFRLHRRDLPGTPDIVFPRFRVAVQVNGCFWHGHEGCRRAALPRTNADFWANKIERNRRRDADNAVALETLGWTLLTLWECQTRDQQWCAAKLLAVMPKRRDLAALTPAESPTYPIPSG